MFEQLSERLSETVRKLRGQARLTDDNIADALRQVRIALLEADVALPVVREFINRVKEKAVGAEVNKSLTPGQVFIKVVNDELVAMMGESNQGLNLATQPPAVILLAGLQGAGKTTTAAKLAKRLIDKDRKRVGVVSADVYRPAAIRQLERVAEQVEARYIESSADEKPVDIARRAVDTAKKGGLDVLIIDTAGRLHVDADLMDEVVAIHAAVKPIETLFVVDSMTGQDAVNSAKAFGEAIDLTGVILTKTDGDARGGAALSVRHITGKPLKFIGTGEGMDKLEPFHPDRVASRILGMGDVVSLVEEVQQKVDTEKAEKLAGKVMKKGGQFDLEDFRDQIVQMQSMGGIGSMLDKMPGMGGKVDASMAERGEKEMKKVVAIVNSMTPHERKHPDVIKGARKRRIAMGSGTQVQDINRLLKQFMEMRKMMKKMKGGRGLARMLGRGGMGGMMGGGMPPFGR